MPSAATVSQLNLGHYEAERAAVLAGVPRSTLYYWARTDLISPSISSHREKLWSYRDLLTLRLVRWLRLPKDDLGVAATTMSDVRKLMDTVGERLWSIHASGREVPTILVGRDGTVFLEERPLSTLDGQYVLEHDQLDLFAPFERGVNLRAPRPRVRIVPAKVAGEPHLVGSRLTTRTVAGLAARGFSVEQIAALYTHEEPEALAEAVELEQSLAA